jgi:predicted nuclease of predicted toxin-antitoxin system
MSIKLLIDMNLSIEWVEVLAKAGFPAVHWTTVGHFCAADAIIMEWARVNGYVVFTHDLDFGNLLAMTQAVGPSVLQIRSRNVLPEQIGTLIISALQQYHIDLANGALVTVDPKKSRVRVLPITS